MMTFCTRYIDVRFFTVPCCLCVCKLLGVLVDRARPRLVLYPGSLVHLGQFHFFAVWNQWGYTKKFGKLYRCREIVRPFCWNNCVGSTHARWLTMTPIYPVNLVLAVEKLPCSRKSSMIGTAGSLLLIVMELLELYTDLRRRPMMSFTMSLLRPP